MESTQHILDTVRPPRVHLTYDVEIGNAEEVVELPFVVGVLADLSGSNNATLPSLSQRKFVDIFPDSFGEVMQATQPSVTIAVPDVIKNDGSEIPVHLVFQTMDDFEPVAIAQAIVPDLYQKRQRLSELLSRISMSEELNLLLESIVTNAPQLQQLKQLVGPGAAAPTGADPKPTTNS